MRLWLTSHCAIKMLEIPSVYNINTDELYELDHEGMEFIQQASTPQGAQAPLIGAQAPLTGVHTHEGAQAPLTGVQAPLTGVQAPLTGVHTHEGAQAPLTGAQAPLTDASAPLIDAPAPLHDNNRTGEFIDFCINEGILSTREVRARRPVTEQAPTPSLRYLELQLTRRCNLNCAHCYISHERDDELKPHEIARTLEEFQNMQGLRVLLTGGEPLIHRDFSRINDILPDYALRFVLFTNGMMLTDKILRKLNAHEIQISLDGMAEAHDTLRGDGAFAAAIGAIERAISHGFETSVSTMIHPANLGDFERMDTMLREMGIKDWTVDVPSVEGSLRANPASTISPSEAGRYLAYGFGGTIHAGAPGYGCGRHLMSVMADGLCAKCAFYLNDPAGRLTEGLAQCWSKVRHYRLEELDCDCNHLEQCRGGCRYRAATLGSETGKDLYRCDYYGKI